MKIHLRRRWSAALGLALVASTIGGLAAASPEFPGDPQALEWYVGDEETVTDPDRSAVPLGLYDDSGAAVSAGSVDAALPGFAAAGAALRPDDSHATLFLHAAQSGTAAGAWPGVQVSGTSRFTGPGAVPAPGPLAGRPRAATGGGYSLAEAATGFSAAGQGTFGGIYELRLRTSSASAGVGEEYASAYVKVTGSTWQIVDGPTPTDVEPAATTTTATVPARSTYGKAFSVPVSVAGTGGSGGTVRLAKGASVLATGTLSAAGAVTLPVGATALAAGTHAVTITYAGTAQALTSSLTKTIVVAKAPSVTTAKLAAKKVKRKKRATITVLLSSAGVRPADLTGTVTVQVGAKVVARIALSLAAKGRATVKLPKLKPGKHKVRVSYAGSANVAGSTSAVSTLKVKKK